MAGSWGSFTFEQINNQIPTTMKHAAAFLLTALAATTQAQVTHELQVEDDEFNPSTLTINAGDHVHILWDNSVVNDHTFTQVAASTWNVNGSTLLPGGYELGVGTPSPGTEFTITPAATVWYVCAFHASMGMKGVINVVGTSGVEEASAQALYQLAPNPASDVVRILAPDMNALNVRFTDATGRLCLNAPPSSERTIDATALNNGMYVVEFRDAHGVLLSRRQLVVEH